MDNMEERQVIRYYTIWKTGKLNCEKDMENTEEK
jgi:hypothetical protein